MNKEQQLKAALKYIRLELMEIRIEIDQIQDKIEFLKKMEMGC